MAWTRNGLGLAAVIGALVLSGCASGPSRAPVEERPVAPRPPVAIAAPGTATAAPETPTRQAPGAENAGKPGYYTVKPGDALIRIGLEVGQSWRDIARWNGLDNPNLIEVGQVLRVAPPGVDPAARPGVATGRPASQAAAPTAGAPGTPSAAATNPAAANAPGAAVATPVTVPGVTPAPAASSAPVVAPPSSTPAAPTTPAARDPDDDLNWAWPAAGPVVGNFEEGRNKGMAITGKAGDPVFAAADGRVVYAGSGLRGYGNLIIIKHNATYLTAYAHNQALLVKEDQAVRRGQRIADMGSTEADRVQLHFEIRRQGKPIDPARLLPAR